jgi:hypothetical protein
MCRFDSNFHIILESFKIYLHPCIWWNQILWFQLNSSYRHIIIFLSFSLPWEKRKGFYSRNKLFILYSFESNLYAWNEMYSNKKYFRAVWESLTCLWFISDPCFANCKCFNIDRFLNLLTIYCGHGIFLTSLLEIRCMHV